MYQFIDQRHDKLKLTQEMILQYEQEFSDSQPLFGQHDVAEIIYRSRCEFLREKNFMSEETDCSSLTEKVSNQMASIDLSSPHREELRDRLDEVLKDVPLNREVAEDRLRLFEMMIICGKHGGCDEDALRSRIRRDGVVFLNSVCTYVKPGRAIGDLRKETEDLAKFLLDGGWEWSEDKGRGNLFFCSYLRDVAQS